MVVEWSRGRRRIRGPRASNRVPRQPEGRPCRPIRSRDPGARPRWLHNSRGTARWPGLWPSATLAHAPDGCITAAEQPGGRRRARRQTRLPDADNATPGAGRTFRIAREPRRHTHLPTISSGVPRPPSRDSGRAPEGPRRERLALASGVSGAESSLRRPGTSPAVAAGASCPSHPDAPFLASVISQKSLSHRGRWRMPHEIGPLGLLDHAGEAFHHLPKCAPPSTWSTSPVTWDASVR